MLALKVILSRLRLKPITFSLAIVLYLTAHQYWFRTKHRNRFSSIKFGSVFVGFTEYNYFLHGFLTLVATYSSHIVTMLMMPWCIVDQIMGSGKLVTSIALYSKREVLYFTLWIGLLLTFLTWYVGSIQRNDLLFPERVAPICLLNLVHAGFYFTVTGVFVLFGKSQLSKQKVHLR